VAPAPPRPGRADPLGALRPRAFPGGVGGGLRLRLRPRGPAGRSPEPRQPLADDLLPLRRRPAQPLGDPSLRARRHRLRAPGHPPARRLRAGRFGPAGLHPDERLPSERDRRLGSWPSRGLATQSRDELLESCAASSGRDRRKRSGG
jgi:hypothetical protein